MIMIHKGIMIQTKWAYSTWLHRCVADCIWHYWSYNVLIWVTLL